MSIIEINGTQSVRQFEELFQSCSSDEEYTQLEAEMEEKNSPRFSWNPRFFDSVEGKPETKYVPVEANPALMKKFVSSAFTKSEAEIQGVQNAKKRAKRTRSDALRRKRNFVKRQRQKQREKARKNKRREQMAYVNNLFTQAGWPVPLGDEKKSVSSDTDMTFEEKMVHFSELLKFKMGDGVMSYLTDSLTKIVGASSVNILELIFRWLQLVRILCVVDDFISRQAAISLFLELHNVKFVERNLLASAVAYLASNKPTSLPVQIVTQGKISSDLDQFGDLLEYTFDSAFADAIKTLLLGVATMEWCDEWMAAKVFTTFGGKIKGATYEIVRICVKSLARIVKVCEDIYEGVPLSEAVFAKDPLVANRVKADTLLFQKDHLYVGLPIEGKFNRHQWIAEMKECIAYFKARQEKTSQLRVKSYSDIAKIITSLESALSTELRNIEASYRNAPYGVIIGEDPGIGKSNLINLIAYVYCCVVGIPYSDEMIFHRDMSSEYWEKLSNQPIIHYSEVASDSSQLLRTKGELSMKEICSVMDSQPMTANMAQAHLKGTVPILPGCVLMDTNRKNLGVELYKYNSGAVLRRFDTFIFDVVEKYRKDLGCGLDPVKVMNDPPKHPLDLYEISFITYDVYGPTKFKERVVKKNMNIFEFVDLLRDRIVRHIKSQEYVRKLRENNSMFKFGKDWEQSEEKKELDELLDQPVAEPRQSSSVITEKAMKLFNYLSVDIEGEYHTQEHSADGELDPRYVPLTSLETQGKHEGVHFFADRRKETKTNFPSAMVFNIRDDWKENTKLAEKISLRTNDRALPQAREAMKYAYVVKISNVQYLYVGTSEVQDCNLCEVRRMIETWTNMPVIFDYQGSFDLDEKDMESDEDLKQVMTVKQKCIEPAQKVLERRGVAAPIVVEPPRVSMRAYAEEAWKATKLVATAASFSLVYGFASIASYCFHDAKNNMLTAAFSMMTFLAAFTVPWWIRVILWMLNGGVMLNMIANKWTRFKLQFRFRALWKVVFAYFGADMPKWFEDYFAGALVLATASLTAYGAYSYLRKPSQKKLVTQAETVPCPAEELKEFDSRFDVGQPVIPRKMSSMADSWGLRVVPPVQSKCTSKEPESLGEKVLRNQRRFLIDLPGSGISTANGFILGVQRDWALTCSHYFSGMKESAELQIEQSRLDAEKVVHKKVLLGKKDLHYLPGCDLVMFRCLSNISFVDLLPYMAGSENMPKIPKAYAKGKSLVVSVTDGPIAATHKRTGEIFVSERAIVYSGVYTTGDCGMAVVTANAANSVGVNYMHVAGSADGTGYACLIPRDAVLKVLSSRQVICQSLSMPDVPTYVSNKLVPLGSLKSESVKSLSRYNSLHHLDFYGYTGESVMAKAKSRLEESIFHTQQFKQLLQDVLKCEDFEPTGKPTMEPGWKTINGETKYINPYAIGLNKANQPIRCLPRDIMEEVIVEMTADRISALEEAGVKKLAVQPIVQAINGLMEEDSYRRINASTAAGFGFKGKKNKYLPLVKEGESTRYPTSEVMQLLRDVVDVMAEGKKVGFVYNVALKDEPRAKEKCDNGSTRLFYVSPLSLLILSKMFLAPYFNLMMSHPRAFHCAIGINMHLDGADVFEYLREFSENIMEGDYGKFDLTMPIDIAFIVDSVRHNVLKHFGYSDKDLLICDALAAEGREPLWCVLNEIYCKPGSQPSGKDGTAQDNSDRNEAMLRVGVKFEQRSLAKDTRQKSDDAERFIKASFQEMLLPVTFGDDILVSVKNFAAAFFNNCVYQRFVRDVLGMEYTTATKSSEMEEFVSIDTAQFLKRNWVKHPQENVMVAPLTCHSLYKMMIWTMPSKIAEENEQMVMNIDSFLRELFFHCDEISYNRMLAFVKEEFLKRWPLTAKLEATHFHSYEKLRRVYILREEMPQHMLELENSSVSDLFTQGGSVPDVRNRNPGASRHPPMDRDHKSEEGKSQRSAMLQKRFERIVALKRELDALLLQQDSFPCPMPGHKVSSMRRSAMYHASSVFRHAVESWHQYDAKVSSLKNMVQQLQESYDREMMRSMVIPVETHADDDQLERDLKLLQLAFEDSQPAMFEFLLQEREKIEAFYDDFDSCMSIDTQSGEAVQGYGQVNTATVEQNVNVMDIGGDDTKVISESPQDNYAIAESLNLESFFNRPVEVATIEFGTDPDQYANLDLYTLMLADPAIRAKLRNYAFFRADIKLRFVVSATQFHYGKLLIGYVPMSALVDRGAAFTYSTEHRKVLISQLKDSFVLNIGDNKPVDLNVPFICPRPYLRLYNTNPTDHTTIEDATDLSKLWITVLNRVEFVGITPTPVTLHVYAQFENVKVAGVTRARMAIETQSEMKTGPIERFASAAARVSGVLSDYVPWAKASEKVFKSIAYVASLFGYSMPLVLPSMHTPVLVRQDAYQNEVVTIGMHTARKMTFDPKQEMTVNPSVVSVYEDELSIAGLAKRKSYLHAFDWSTTNVPADLLWSMLVSPCVLPYGVNTGVELTYQPTVLAWLCRPFAYWHGKVRLDFMINKSNFHRGKLLICYDPATELYSNADSIQLNENKIILWDIQETDTISICVDWNRPDLWAKTLSVQDAATCLNPDAVSSTLAAGCNGYIKIIPFTKLEGPDSSLVTVNVFISAEDMHLNYYQQENLPLSIMTQSGSMMEVDGSCFEINTPTMRSDVISLEEFGEEPLSLRSYLKRYETTVITAYTGSPVGRQFFYGDFYSIPPIYPPYDGTIPAQYRPTLLSYLRLAFLGMRGSLRKRLMFPFADFTAGNHVKVSLNPISTSFTELVYNGGLNWSSSTGTATFVPRTNGGFEFELPLYTNNLFLPSAIDDRNTVAAGTLSTNFSPGMVQGYTVGWSVNDAVTGKYVTEETAVGEDFSLLRFIAAPNFSIPV